MVIDVFLRVSLVGIEILKIDARIVVASVDTYLRFAEICNRLDLENDSTSRPSPNCSAARPGRSAGPAPRRPRTRWATRSRRRSASATSDDEEDETADGTSEEKRPRRRTAARNGSGSRTRSRRRDEED